MVDISTILSFNNNLKIRLQASPHNREHRITQMFSFINLAIRVCFFLLNSVINLIFILETKSEILYASKRYKFII